MDIHFLMPTQVRMEEDCVRRHGGELAGLGRHALIVTGAHSARANGSLTDVEAALAANGQSWTVFDRVMENPTIDCVYEGAALARSEGADFVIGIGGGSPMDASKAIAWLSCEDVPRDKLFGGFYGRRLPLCCIPTTAGTGSEVTQYAVLTDDARQTKTSLAAPALFADLALLDGRYLERLPHSTMVNTVIDSLSHSMEGYLSAKADVLSDALALQAVGVIGSILPRLSADQLTGGDRARLLYASALGGMVIAQTGTTAVHAMGYPLTYFRHVPHGRANGLLLPDLLAMVAPVHPGRVEALLSALGAADVSAFREIMDVLLGRRETLTAQEAEAYTASASRAKNLANCVLPFGPEQVRALYRAAFGV